MKQYKKLYLIGTSHIAIESVQEVERVIKEIKPEIVAIELDKKRLYALLSKKKNKIRLRDISKIGFKGYLFNLIGAWVENTLGRAVGIKPGADMKKAIESAGVIGAKVALVDQDIEKTLKRLSEEITWKEKFTFIGEIIKGIFYRRKQIRFDLRKVPNARIIKKLTNKLKKSYPSFYKVLVKERNEYMAKALYKLMTLNQEKEIVAVVGAGHEEEIIDLIKHETKVHSKRG